MPVPCPALLFFKEDVMNLLQGNVKKLYSKYFAAAFGSALISSVYGLVDMAMVGQYAGPSGTAALAVVAPIWNIIYSLGLLTGIGGSVLFSTMRGQNEDGNDYFTTAFIGTVFFASVSWIGIAFFDKELLLLFGASQEILPIAQSYLLPIKFAVPLFVFNQMLAAFLRNDGSPGLATAAVLAGGVINVFGDFFFVFTMNMGAMGAGLATALCALITFIIMLSHFFSKKNTLKLVKPVRFFLHLKKILVTGFSTFFIDVAMGILTMLFNRQIMTYFGADALAVYGVIVNVGTIVQCCAYSVGQASQPIISMNFGAKQWARIRETLKYALRTVCFFSIVWTAATLLFPDGFIRIFMSPTNEVLAIAPAIMRSYCISFLLLPFNIFSTYYFQALMKPGTSLFVSVARGLVISGLLIYLLPVLAGADSLWFAMPITELVIAIVVVWLMVKYTKELEKNSLYSSKA